MGTMARHCGPPHSQHWPLGLPESRTLDDPNILNNNPRIGRATQKNIEESKFDQKSLKTGNGNRALRSNVRLGTIFQSVVTQKRAHSLTEKRFDFFVARIFFFGSSISTGYFQVRLVRSLFFFRDFGRRRPNGQDALSVRVSDAQAGIRLAAWSIRFFGSGA